MRYYEFAISGVAENIKELLQNKECLREYRWANALCAVNSYMYHNLRNNLGFLVYRQETDDKILAVLFFDEKKETLENAYDYIIEVLECVFEIKRIQLTPSEITMYKFLECYREAKRRDLDNHGNRFVELSNLFIYEYSIDHSKSYHFEFAERIIPEIKAGKTAIYDKDFITELSNIESHSHYTEYKSNLVHYIISSKNKAVLHEVCRAEQELINFLYDEPEALSERQIYAYWNSYMQSYIAELEEHPMNYVLLKKQEGQEKNNELIGIYNSIARLQEAYNIAVYNLEKQKEQLVINAFDEVIGCWYYNVKPEQCFVRDDVNADKYKMIECVFDNPYMYMFKLDKVKRNLTGYVYEDTFSRYERGDEETINVRFDVDFSYQILEQMGS